MNKKLNDALSSIEGVNWVEDTASKGEFTIVLEHRSHTKVINRIREALPVEYSVGEFVCLQEHLPGIEVFRRDDIV